MSLMFAALRTLEGERVAAPAVPVQRRRLPAMPWPAAWWLGAGVALGGGLFWLAMPRAPSPLAHASTPMLLMAPVAAQMPPPSEAPVAARASAAPPVPPPTPAVVSTASVAQSDTPPQVQAPAPTIAASTAPAPPNTPVEPVATAAPATHGFAPLPAGSLVVRDAAVPAPRAQARDADEPDPATVARHVDAMGSAIDGGDFTAAQDELQALQHLLPAQSLTLLRMRAWLAQRRGDTAQALPLYREIVGRMPGDRGAAINLALLEAGNGQLDDARQRLRGLQAGESEASDNERQALARAVAEVGVAP